MAQANQQIKAIGDLWEIVQQYRWRLIIPAFITTAMVLAVGMFLPRKYGSEAVFERRTDMVLAEILRQGASGRFQDPRQSLNEEISGGPAIDQLLDEHEKQIAQIFRDLSGSYNRPALRSDLMKRVVISYDIASNDVDRIRVGYVGTDPKLTTLVVNGLVNNYIDRTRKLMDDRLHKSSQFFANEVDKNRKLIEELENQQLAFEIDHAQLLPDTPVSIQNEMTTIEETLKQLDQRRTTLRSSITALTTSLDKTPKTQPTMVHGRNPERSRLERKMEQLESTLADYVGVQKMTDHHPDLVALRQQMAELQHRIDTTDAEVVTATQVATNPMFGDLQVRLTAAKAELESVENQHKLLDTQLNTLKTEASKMYPVRSDYRKLTRRIEEVQRQLAFWENNLRRVDMTLAADRGNRGIQLDLIRPASPSPRPVSPKLNQVLMAAIALGLLAGVVSIISAQRTDETFRDGSQLAKVMGLPLMGAVSEIISRQQQRVRRLRTMVLYPTGAAAMLLVLTALVALLYTSLEGTSDDAPQTAQATAQAQQSRMDNSTILEELGNH